MQGILAIPIPLLNPFLNLRTNLLVTSHPKKLCCKLIDHKNYFLCGAWSCRTNSIKSVITPSSFTDNRMAWQAGDPQSPQTSITVHHATLLLFPGTLHFMAARHIQVVGERAMFTFGISLFLWGCFDATVSAISPSTGPFPQMTSHPKHQRDFKPPWSKGGGWKKTWCRQMSHLCHWLKHCCQNTLFSL